MTQRQDKAGTYRKRSIAGEMHDVSVQDEWRVFGNAAKIIQTSMFRREGRDSVRWTLTVERITPKKRRAR